jgi:hypothetical protein
MDLVLMVRSGIIHPSCRQRGGQMSDGTATLVPFSWWWTRLQVLQPKPSQPPIRGLHGCRRPHRRLSSLSMSLPSRPCPGFLLPCLANDLAPDASFPATGRGTDLTCPVAGWAGRKRPRLSDSAFLPPIRNLVAAIATRL